MWVLKFHGETFYVNHVESDLAWSTKETPGSNHTKGSIKFRNALVTIDDDNCAHISRLTMLDKIRLRNQKLGITRVIFTHNSPMNKALINKEFQHSPFKRVEGDCGTSFYVCDLLDKQEVTLAVLKYHGWFRILQPNEAYYQAYDGPNKYIDEDLVDN